MKLKKLSVLTILLILVSFSFYQSNTQQKDSQVTSPVKTEVNEPERSSLPAVIPATLKVHFIDVGQGDSILIQTPNGKSMLIDAGKNSEGLKVLNYIKALGINKIDVIVATHPHEDHIGGMDLVVKNFTIGSIYMPKKSTTTKTFEDLLNAVKEKGLKISTAFAGVDIDIDTSVKIRMLAPNNNNYEDLNNYSAVIKLIYNKTSFLLTGDAQNLSEQEMLSKGYYLKSDVLKVGHHGSHSSTSPEFLKAVNPEYAVVSVAKINEYGHPHKETISELAAANIKVFRTDEAGTIVATSDGKTIKFDKVR